jgi:hypothetical protein
LIDVEVGQRAWIACGGDDPMPAAGELDGEDPADAAASAGDEDG